MTTMEALEFATHSLRVKARITAGIVLVCITGALTPAALHASHARLRGVYGRCGEAWVWDFRGAALAITVTNLQDAMALAAKDTLPTPLALVCAPDCLDLFRDHAIAAARHGFMRRVFFDVTQAWQWALEQRDRRRARGELRREP